MIIWLVVPPSPGGGGGGGGFLPPPVVDIFHTCVGEMCGPMYGNEAPEAGEIQEAARRMEARSETQYANERAPGPGPAASGGQRRPAAAHLHPTPDGTCLFLALTRPDPLSPGIWGWSFLLHFLPMASIRVLHQGHGATVPPVAAGAGGGAAVASPPTPPPRSHPLLMGFGWWGWSGWGGGRGPVNNDRIQSNSHGNFNQWTVTINAAEKWRHRHRNHRNNTGNSMGHNIGTEWDGVGRGGTGGGWIYNWRYWRYWRRSVSNIHSGGGGEATTATTTTTTATTTTTTTPNEREREMKSVIKTPPSPKNRRKKEKKLKPRQVVCCQSFGFRFFQGFFQGFFQRFFHGFSRRFFHGFFHGFLDV